ncbi:hypothetical protein PLESTB_001273000 [Pleodorina starrii]|uniref:Uncharacterized protein n=1 Tax=Pleodorina starrii TaxID=330485 RepID=A0A9W6F6Q3_9CHLO|nr:hypothetical protein PLESTM_002021100 [Pleodorina starrii]GLC57840.1 hypothetical protein PLESTB_001273000 [Pleodorina starrii]GLC75986.1 hypothetical protein PLESTF_001714900 [Pleodorina starrii]
MLGNLRGAVQVAGLRGVMALPPGSITAPRMCILSCITDDSNAKVQFSTGAGGGGAGGAGAGAGAGSAAEASRGRALDSEDEDPAVLEQRKRRSIQTYLEQQLGGGDSDRVTLAVLLQRHGVVVRGGQPEALKLMEALAAWKRGEWRPQQQQQEEATTTTTSNSSASSSDSSSS